MTDELEFCTLTPDFPEEAFMVFLKPIKGARPLDPYPMAFIYRTLDEVNEVVTEAVQEIKESAEFNVQQHALLLPVRFESLFEMRREFWQSTSHHYDSLDRLHTFQPVARTPQFFKLLVTPTYLDESGKWHLNATLPLYHPYSTAVIEKFMFNADQSVDERARYSAVYSFGESSHYNWETQEVSAAKIKHTPNSFKN